MEFYLADDCATLAASPADSWDTAGMCPAGGKSVFLSSSPGFMIPVTQDLSPALSPRGIDHILVEAGTHNSEVQVDSSYAGDDLQTLAEAKSNISWSRQRLKISGFAYGSDIPGVDSQIYHAWGEDGASILQHLEASGCELHQRIASFSFQQQSLRRAPYMYTSQPGPSDPDGGISTEDDTSKKILMTDPELARIPIPESHSCPSTRSNSSDFDQHLQDVEFGGPVQVDGTYLEASCEVLNLSPDLSLQSSDEERQNIKMPESYPRQGSGETGGFHRNSTASLEQAIKDFAADVGRFEQAVEIINAEIRSRWPQDIQVLEQKERLRTRHQFSRAEMLCLAKAVKKVLSVWFADQGPSLAFWKAVYEATKFPPAISPSKLQAKWRYELCKYSKRQHSRRANPGDKRFKEWRCDHLSFCNHLLGKG